MAELLLAIIAATLLYPHVQGRLREYLIYIKRRLK